MSFAGNVINFLVLDVSLEEIEGKYLGVCMSESSNYHPKTTFNSECEYSPFGKAEGKLLLCFFI